MPGRRSGAPAPGAPAAEGRDGDGDGGARRRRRTGRDGAPPAPPADPAAAAREVCLRLLTVRPRSRAELAAALRTREIPGEVAEAVLGRFSEVGLVDDAAFAEVVVRSGHRYRGLGRRALSAELRHKGVADEVARAAVAAIDGEDEERRARELVRRKLRSATSAPDEVARVRRLVGMLARKGYPEGLAFRVVREELALDAAELPDPDH